MIALKTITYRSPETSVVSVEEEFLLCQSTDFPGSSIEDTPEVPFDW